MKSSMMLGRAGHPLKQQFTVMVVLYCHLQEIQAALPGYGKSSTTQSYQCVQHFLCVQTMVWLPVFGIFNVRSDVDAYDCICGLYRHCKRVCTGN